MKHIKKKFRYENCDFFEKIKKSTKSSVYNIDSRINHRDLKDKFLLMQHKSGTEFLSFAMKHKNESFLMPIPDYTLMFYNHAYLLKPALIEHKDKLLKSLRKKSSERTLCANEIYTYFGYLTSFIFNLYCSFESYVNKCVSNRCYKLKKHSGGFEIQDPQRNMSLSDKIKVVFPKIYERNNFWAEHIQYYQSIVDLHQLRDDLAHTKADSEFYDYIEIDLFQRLVNFNHEASLVAVRKFVDHYTPGYMEDCDCDKDF